MGPEDAPVTAPEVDQPGSPWTAPPGDDELVEATKMPRWGKVVIVTLVVGIAIVIAGFVIRVPYSTIAPGDAISLTKLVKVDGAKTFDEPRGDIRLLFVRERTHINVWRYLQARLDDDIELYKEEQLNPGGVPQPDLAAEAQAQMASAKIGATKVALEAAGYDVTPADKGVVVLAALPSRPAGKVMETNDLIVAADGAPIADNTDLRAAIAKHTDGEKVKLDILRGGKEQTVEVAVEVKDGNPSIGVIVSPRFNFPVNVTVDTNNIGGPSGGLAMALAITDDLTAGDITGGRRIAVTGTIDSEGHVGEIGGIAQKAVAARARKAKLFLVPKCEEARGPESVAACQTDLQRAIDRAGDSVKVLPVGSFDEALRVLRENGGEPVEKSAPEANAA
jgi:Lon-like protease